LTKDRCRAIENIVQRAQGSGRIAFRGADHRAGITYLTGAGPLVIERREAGAGFAGPPEAGLRGEQPPRDHQQQGART